MIGIYKGLEPPCGFEKVNERWEVGVGLSDGTFQQVSFVNSICTMKGGCHVAYIADQIATRLAAVSVHCYYIPLVLCRYYVRTCCYSVYTAIIRMFMNPYIFVHHIHYTPSLYVPYTYTLTQPIHTYTIHIQIVKKKNKGVEVKPSNIKNHLSIYVNALITNPAFDSQTKETLTTKAVNFGSTCMISEKLFKIIEKSGII